MTIQEIARREEITERSAQRYVTNGYRGHKLPATRRSRAFWITPEDYRDWRIACGFERPQTQPQVIEPHTVPCKDAPGSPRSVPVPKYPPWPKAADPNGELTTGPSEHSRNWPHPKSCEEYMAQQLRKQQRGYEDEE
jgi:hypothetical protein